MFWCRLIITTIILTQFSIHTLKLTYHYRQIQDPTSMNRPLSLTTSESVQQGASSSADQELLIVYAVKFMLHSSTSATSSQLCISCTLKFTNKNNKFLRKMKGFRDGLSYSIPQKSNETRGNTINQPWSHPIPKFYIFNNHHKC